MHKIIFTIGTVLTTFLGFSQITMNIEGQTADIAGTTHTINVSDGNEVIVDVLIHNHSGVEKEWKITRTRLDVPSTGWTDYLCWGAEGDPFGGTCYGASQMSTSTWICPTSVFVQDGNAGLLAIHVDPNDTESSSGLYRYYVGRTLSQPQDSLDVQINVNLLSVKENKVKNFALLVSPNPADDYFTLTLPSNVSEGTIKIIDVLGKSLLEEKIYNTKKISTESFKNGVYFVSLNSNGTNYTKRFVIKH